MTKSVRAKPPRGTRKGWTLQLLGPPALHSPDGAEHRLERRAAALFALVAIEPGIARSRVAALLWPESEPSRARQALRQQLLRLKSVAGRELLGGEVALSLAPDVGTDLRAGGARGMLLGDLDYTPEEDFARWLDEHRRGRRESGIDRLAQRVAEAERAGELDAAARIAAELVAASGEEVHHRALIRLHYLRGDVVQAQAAYDRLRDTLERELGAKPSAESQQLARTLRSAAEPVRAPAFQSPPPSVLRPPRLVGREREWQEVEAAWEKRQPLVVAGVGGMGKTRLVGDFAATRGSVASVAARPGDEQVAYSLLARLLRVVVARLAAPPVNGVRAELARLLPELGEATPPRDATDLARLLRAIESLVDSAIGAGLVGLVVEDLHFADGATLEALRSPAFAEPRLARILTCRLDEIPPDARALVDALVDSGRGRLVSLAPLSVAQVAELIDSLDIAGLAGAEHAESIARHTGGNPLFVLETIKAMLVEPRSVGVAAKLPVTQSVSALIGRRIARLSPDAVRLARCAAVAGQDFSAELAAHVLGVRALDLADAWNELSMAQVLREGSFVHDLVHEAALASVPAPIAKRLHADIAAFLEGAGAKAGRVAGHWEAAGRTREAGAALARAAAEAHATGRRTEEAELLARAAQAFADCGDPDARFEALLARIDAVMANDVGEAAREAIALATRAATDEGRRLRVLRSEVAYLDSCYDSVRAVEASREAMELANRAGRRDLVLDFAVSRAGALSDLRRVDEAIALLEPLREEATGAQPRSYVGYFAQLGVALDLDNRLADALREFERARVAAVAHGLKDQLATLLSNIATTTSKRGQLTRAVEFGHQALQLWRESESLAGLPSMTQALLAHRLRDVGRYEEAVDMLEAALEEFQRAGLRPWVAAAAHRLALAYSQLGQHARARKLIDAEPDGCAQKTRAVWLAHRAEIRRASGVDGMQALREARELLEPDLDDGNNRLVDLFATAIVPAEEGEPLATAVAAWAAARERFGMAVAGHTRAAACALEQGATGRALAQVEAALRLFAQSEPDNFYRAEVWWVAHRVFAASGRHDEARRMAQAGNEWVTQVCERHVRPEFRDSFLNRNATNRALILAVRRVS